MFSQVENWDIFQFYRPILPSKKNLEKKNYRSRKHWSFLRDHWSFTGKIFFFYRVKLLWDDFVGLIRIFFDFTGNRFFYRFFLSICFRFFFDLFSILLRFFFDFSSIFLRFFFDFFSINLIFFQSKKNLILF